MATTLYEYVGGTDKDTAFITQCSAEATELVDERCKGSTVPTATKARAVLEVGADLFNRRRARNGITGIDSPDVSPMRIRADPMKAAQSILAPFLEPGIG